MMTGWIARSARLLVPLTPVADPGLLMTDATVQGVKVLHGNVQPGETLTVEQVGGTDVQGQQWVDAHNPLFQAGQEEILFLMKDSDGTYSTVAGSQGRFSIDAADKVRPRASGEWGYLEKLDGLTVDVLKATVDAAQSL